jgi:hypothetical protein
LIGDFQKLLYAGGRLRTFRRISRTGKRKETKGPRTPITEREKGASLMKI